MALRGVGYAASRAQLRDPEVDGVRAGGEPAPAISVSPVAGPACLVGLGVHDLVDERLCHHPDELAMFSMPSTNLGAVARDLAHLVHVGLLPFFES